jgi:DNA-binding response OmpR family regulator
MSLKKIEELLETCSVKDLEYIEQLVQEMVVKAKIGKGRWDDEEGHMRRREPRFDTKMLGTLTRVTDVKPGERKEFSVTICDVSRSGMKLIVDPNFIPSRVVDVTFAAPGGKIKRSVLEIVRMRKMVNEDGSWLEIGCRSIGEEESRRIRLQEEKIAKMRSKLHKKAGILILLVGPETSETTQMLARIKSADYQIKHITAVREAMKNAEKMSAQLVILCHGSDICEDEKAIAELKTAPPGLAILAIVENDADRFLLLHAGVDECITRVNGSSREDFLFYAIERALVGHVVRRRDRQGPTAKALIIGTNNTKVNLITYQLEEHGYTGRSAQNLEEAKNFEEREFDLIFVDFDNTENEDLEQTMKYFYGLPVIAMCDEIGYGHQAMSLGANNYICMPPGREEMRMILESLAADMPAV